MSTETIRMAMLEFLSALSNEIQMYDVDEECSEFVGMPKLIDKFRHVTTVLEQVFPLVQAVDEVLLGEISPKLFWAKWEKVAEHIEYPEGTIDTIGDDVMGFLGKFSLDGDDDAAEEGEDD